jgi:hypothetical protein
MNPPVAEPNTSAVLLGATASNAMTTAIAGPSGLVDSIRSWYLPTSIQWPGSSAV